MSGRCNPEITEARRDILRGIVKRNPGCTTKDALAEALKIHERGKWPQASWAGARNEPYSGGIGQMLDQLWYISRRATSLESGQAMRVTKLPLGQQLVEHLPGCPEGVVAVGAIDERKECEALIRRFQHEAGMELVLGVEEDGKRLVRIGTRRGVVDWRFDPYYTVNWIAAIKVAALEVGCNL